MPSFSGPEGYARARSTNSPSADLVVQVENRPYFPFLVVDPSEETGMIQVARAILNAYEGSNDSIKSHNSTEEAQITRISGGLTNALFKIDLPSSVSSPPTPQSASPKESVLVRIFGAEGMIDRDLETATFARLCGAASDNSRNGGLSDANAEQTYSEVVHPSLDLLGRFANGRVESWIPNMKQSIISDFASSSIMNGLAQALARLHYGFEVPSYLYEVECREVDGRRERVRVLKPGLWNVIYEWVGELEGALGEFDEDLMRLIYQAVLGKECSESHVTLQSMGEEIVSHLQNETRWLQSMVEQRHPHAIVAFTHNDLCTANILLDESNNNSLDDNALCIIDYEYGSINYTMYDVANFFCELCGGNDNGIPNRELFPSEERQRAFLKEYIREKRKVLESNGEVRALDGNGDECISELQSQIQLFQMASNLIWGVWGVLQACGEVKHDTFCSKDAKLRLGGEIGLESFDNLRYGKHRLANYLVCKEAMDVR